MAIKHRHTTIFLLLLFLLGITIILIWQYSLNSLERIRFSKAIHTHLTDEQNKYLSMAEMDRHFYGCFLFCQQALIIRDSIDEKDFKKVIKGYEQNYFREYQNFTHKYPTETHMIRNLEEMHQIAGDFFSWAFMDYYVALRKKDIHDIYHTNNRLLILYGRYWDSKQEMIIVLHEKYRDHIYNDEQEAWQSHNLLRLIGIMSLLVMGVISSIIMFTVRRSEKDIRESEMQYRTIANYTYDWEFWMDTDGSFKYVSPSVFRITGYYSEDFIRDPNHFEKIVHPEDREILLDHKSKMLYAQQDFYHIDFRIISRNGKVKWISQNAQPVYQFDKWIGIRGSNRDFTLRKEAELALRESEERFRTLAESIPDGVIVHNKDIILYSNKAGVNMLCGRKKVDLLGLSVKKFVVEVEDEVVSKRLNTVFETKESQVNELKIKRLDDKMVEVEAITALVKWKNETILQTIFRDITNRKEAERGRREAERKYESLFRDSLSVMLIIDPENGNILEANRSAGHFYGYKHEPLVNMNVDQLAVALPSHSIKSLIDGKHKRNHFILKHKLSEGTIKDVEIYSGRISLGAKDAIYWIIHDITERVMAEQALMESEEKFRRVFNMSTSAIFINDLKGKFIEMNETACNMLEYTKEELQKLEPASISTTKKKTKFDGRVDELIQTDQLLFGTALLTKGGKIIPIEATSSIVNYQNKKAILTLVNDITEKEQMQNRLLKTILKTEEKERRRFATDLHDGMGSLLSSISIYLDLLKQEDIGYKERLGLADYAIGLVNDAIASSKEIANNLRPSTITKFGLVASLRAFCDKINLTGTLYIDLDTEQFVKPLDNSTEVILFRIINELINNTIQHSAAKNIKIKLSNSPNNLYLNYSDDGDGFDVEKVLHDVGRGAGLTNIISRTRSISGECSIRSEIGKGTEVLIEAPIKKE